MIFGKKTKRCYRCDKEVDLHEWKTHQGYCAKCFEDWQSGKPSPFSINASEGTIPMTQEEYPWGGSVALQKDEVPLRWMDVKSFLETKNFRKS